MDFLFYKIDNATNCLDWTTIDLVFQTVLELYVMTE